MKCVADVRERAAATVITLVAGKLQKDGLKLLVKTG